MISAMTYERERDGLALCRADLVRCFRSGAGLDSVRDDHADDMAALAMHGCTLQIRSEALHLLADMARCRPLEMNPDDEAIWTDPGVMAA